MYSLIKCGLLTFLLFASSNVVAGQTIQTIPFAGNPTEPKLKGPVHSVLTVEQRGDHVFGSSVEIYDLSGRLVETLATKAGIEIHSEQMVRLGGKTTRTYDSKGNFSREYSFSPEGIPNMNSIYKYDAQNRVSEEVTYYSDGREFERRSYKYLPGNLEVEMKRQIDFGEGRRRSSKYLVTFNQKGAKNNVDRVRIKRQA